MHEHERAPASPIRHVAAHLPELRCGGPPLASRPVDRRTECVLPHRARTVRSMCQERRPEPASRLRPRRASAAVGLPRIDPARSRGRSCAPHATRLRTRPRPRSWRLGDPPSKAAVVCRHTVVDGDTEAQNTNPTRDRSRMGCVAPGWGGALNVEVEVELVRRRAHADRVELLVALEVEPLVDGVLREDVAA